MSKVSSVENHLTHVSRSNSPWNDKILNVVKTYKIPAEEAGRLLDIYRVQTEPSILNKLKDYLTHVSNLTISTWQEKVIGVIKALDIPLIETIELLDKYCNIKCIPTYKSLIVDSINVRFLMGGKNYAMSYTADELSVPVNEIDEVYYKYILGPVGILSYKQLLEYITAVKNVYGYTNEQKITYISQTLNVDYQRASELFYE